MTISAGADPEILESSVAFHLSAGIDVVVVWAAGSTDSATVGRLSRDDRVHFVRDAMSSSPEAVATWTVERFSPDWFIAADAREYWWPRVGSFANALSAVPTGSNAAQAIVRTLFSVKAEGPFEERFAMRLSPRAPSLDGSWRSERKYAVRADAIHTNAADLDVLWGYYPFEVLRLATDGHVETSDPIAEHAQALGVLVPDTRLGNTIGALRSDSLDGASFRPTEEPLTFDPPDLADEAVFALEAAVVHDLELALARQQLDVLSQRLRTIERSRFLQAEGTLRRAIRPLRRSRRPPRPS